MWQRLFPFLRWWPDVNRHSLRADAIAGITGAVVVLPQGVAFATIAGMPPEYGLYAAMFPAVIAALFGSSRLLVSGPTTAASIVLYSILSEMADPGTANYVYLALTLTFMVGLVQLCMGLARLGHLVNFISHSVIIGFTTGAAILIVASQIRYFFGLYIPPGLPFHEIIQALYRNFSHINLATTSVGVGTIVIGLLTRRFYPRAPYMIVAIVYGSLMAYVINTFTSYFVALIGIVPAAFPPLSSPNFSFRTWQQLAPAALAVTLFALTEAVSISRSLAARTGELVDGNQEFIGQGLSNMVGSFFSAYVATGSFNRSGVNYEAGARTPMASIFAAFMLILVLLLVGPLLAYLPKAVMAGVLFLVAAGLIDVSHIRIILKASQPDSVVLIATFAATLLLELDFAIMLGVLLSLVIYLHQASRPRVMIRVPDPRQPKRRFNTDPSLPQCPQMQLIRIDGAVFFGAVNYVGERLRVIFKRNPEQKHLLILARPVSFIDVAGAEMLVREHRQRKAIGGGLYFHQLQEPAREILRKSGYLDEIGEESFFDNKGDAIGGVFAKLDRDICRSCKKRIFNECKSVPRDSRQEGPRRVTGMPRVDVRRTS